MNCCTMDAIPIVSTVSPNSNLNYFSQNRAKLCQHTSCVLNVRVTFVIEWHQVAKCDDKRNQYYIFVDVAVVFQLIKWPPYLFSSYFFWAGFYSLYELSSQAMHYTPLFIQFFPLVLPLVNHFDRQIRMIDNYSNLKCFIFITTKKNFIIALLANTSLITNSTFFVIGNLHTN